MYVNMYVHMYLHASVCMYLQVLMHVNVHYMLKESVYLNKEVYKNLHFTPSIITVMFVLASTSFTIKNNTYNKLNS